MTKKLSAMPSRRRFCMGAILAPIGLSWGQSEKTKSPALPFRMELIREINPEVKNLKGIAIGKEDRLYCAGSEGVALLDAKGKQIRFVKTEKPCTCVAVDGKGFIYAASQVSIERFDSEGKRIASWGKSGSASGEFLYITSLAVKKGLLFVCDAGNRRVHRYTTNGDFGDDKRGFNIPSPFFDCDVDEKEHLYVANTASHRIEHYDGNWRLRGSWGKYGVTPETFCGCCNPTNIARFPDGRIAATTKGIPSLKVFDATGKLLAWLGPEAFPKGIKGMDLAIDSAGNIALAEVTNGKVRYYALKKMGGEGQTL